MSDQSDPSRFEPPAGGAAPEPTPSSGQPVTTGEPTQKLPAGSTQEIPRAEPRIPATEAFGAWTSGTPDNPYEPGDRFGFDATGIRPTGEVSADGDGAGGGGKRLAMMGLGATAVAAIVLGGGYLAYDRVLGGGGAQPESVIPANAIAFAKVDLDPSGGQKIDALRFIRKFPKAPVDTKKDDADLRKVIFDQLQKDGQLKGLDYARDVQPWLGSRFGVAALPGADADRTVSVVALAVTDTDKAKSGLAKLSAADSNTHCSVGDDYALCGEDATAVAAALKSAQTTPLAEAEGFAGDLGSLGEDGIASFWLDMSKAKDLAKQAEVGGAGALTEQYKGHFFGALRFDGPTLELVGKGTGLADSGISGSKNGVGALPADTLAAFGLSGGKEYAKKLWGNLEKAGLTSDVQSMTDETGLSLPGDLQTLFGNSFAVAFGGMGEGGDAMPKVALVTDSKEADVKTLAGKVEQLVGTPFSIKAGNGRTVVALEQGYADAVASGKGLGDDAAFKDAVPDADSASVVLYANIGRMVQAFGSDMSADDRKMADVFKSVGVSAGAKGTEADFRMRLTTN
jgi:hypothetical protein